ncbi:MAG: Uma2 family endonuclease [Fimbriimonadia bacterium]|nr:Uma2 family endonuclease [Fimbriimonadia bacterium]
MGIQIMSRRMRLTEFLALPEPESSDTLLELLNGEIRETPRPKPQHNQGILRLGAALLNYVETREIGTVFPDTLVVLDEQNQTAVAPDIAFFTRQSLASARIENAVFATPELAVEILSPSTRAYDRGEKMAIYHRHQVPWIWLMELDPVMIEEYQWSEAGYVLTQVAHAEQAFQPRLFPDFQISLKMLSSF